MPSEARIARETQLHPYLFVQLLQRLVQHVLAHELAHHLLQHPLKVFLAVGALSDVTQIFKLRQQRFQILATRTRRRIGRLEPRLALLESIQRRADA